MLFNCMLGIAVFGAFGGANAATGRASMMLPTTTAGRMPTIPIPSITTIGNPAVLPTDIPVHTPVGSTTPVNPPHPDPEPEKECLDGGVKNSQYTITMCMNDILQCVNTGALQGGLTDLYNEDVRNSILNGMKLCQVHVDKCISEVRVDCRNVYNVSNDVWLDFNSRIVQPEYYNFVLRKTGLTPNQAENTCLLLDRNTYGTSFAAVSDTNAVNTEYSNKVGAYNAANNGVLSKDNPQGVAVNTVGYDGNRGHYARWDAAKAECLLRVAAYNKDKLITNSWLFGAVGNDKPAEVWEKAGSTFTCNKELFDFSSLLNDTKTAAVIGVGGGALLGGAIGAGAGAAAYNKKAAAAAKAEEELASKDPNPCADEEYRKKLGTQIMNGSDGNLAQTLKIYLYNDVKLKTNSEGKQTTEVDSATSDPLFPDNNLWKINKAQCEAILDLGGKINVYKLALDNCTSVQTNNRILTQVDRQGRGEYERITITGNGMLISGGVQCGQVEGIAQTDVDTFNEQCMFVPLQLGFAVEGPQNPFCNHNGMCKTATQIRSQLRALEDLLAKISPAIPSNYLDGSAKKLSKGKEIGKGLAIGMATGAAAGGIATAITAFVEKSNITCKVGDGLNSVALGKSHSIDSLKDFYVKWNLHLPDTVSPTSAVIDRSSWEQACSQFNNKLQDCPRVQINYKKGSTYELIPSACVKSGTLCIVNESVATSHGVK